MSGGSLGRCIGLPVDEFARHIWGTAPLLTRDADGDRRFADLFSVAAVDELVSRRALRTPFVRMVRDGSLLDPSVFTRSGGAGAGIADQVADDKVLGQLAGGATLILQALHRSWFPLNDFCIDLAAEIGHPVQVNAYITPAENRGFAAHYDTHDVFVLQIAGSKRWLIHPPVIDDPLPDMPEQQPAAVAERAAEPPMIDAVLRPGDALYLPRGFVHSAVAQGELSIHLTVGVHAVTGYDLVLQLMQAAVADPELRRSLPLGIQAWDLPGLTELVGVTAKRLIALLDGLGHDGLAAAAAGVRRQLNGEARPQPVTPLGQLTAIERLHGRSILRLRTGLAPTLTRDGEAAQLELIDSIVRWPAIVHDALAIVLTGAHFRPADLPNLDTDEQLVVARRLLREGVVVPFEPPPGPG